MVFDSDVVLKLFPLLGHGGRSHAPTAALRAVVNIVTGSDEQTQVVLNYGAVFYFPTLLSNLQKKSCKEVLWFMSN